MCDECCWCWSSSEEPPRSVHPRKNVCCTDIIFLVIFVVFCCGMVYVAAFSIMQGDSLRLVYGYDSFGNTCNRNNTPYKIDDVTFSGQNLEGRSNVLFLDVTDPFNSMQLCVTKCPDEDLNSSLEVQEFSMRTGSALCRYDIPVADYVKGDLVWSPAGPCPKLPILKSISLLSRCVPDVIHWVSHKAKSDTLKPFFKFINNDTPFRKLLSDLYASWREMLALCGVALVISFLMIVMIRFMAACMIWTIVVLAGVSSIVGTGFLWWTYIQTKIGVNNRAKEYNIPLLDVDVQNETAFLVFSIVATVLTVVLLLVILVMRSRLALVVALFHEAGKCLVSMPCLLIQPFITFFILVVFFAWWLFVLAHISTAGSPTADYSKGFQRLTYEKQGVVSYFWWYHVFGFIWVSEFILACQQFVIAGAVANWYFCRPKAKLSFPILKSIGRLLLHHVGSVAFGSFFIVLVKIPRYILMYINSKFKDSQSSIAKCCMKCCICCLMCLEKFLMFLNQNAYTLIAIRGMSFCPAAMEAFKVITNNVLRVVAINSVGDFVLFLGKVAVMAMTGAASVFWFKNDSAAISVAVMMAFGYVTADCMLSLYESYSSLHYFAAPVIIICAFAFLIAHCFLTIYEMVIDTLLLCFCEDCQMNDGTPGKEYFMGDSLKDMMRNSSAELENRRRPMKKGDGEGNPEEKPMALAAV